LHCLRLLCPLQCPSRNLCRSGPGLQSGNSRGAPDPASAV
jgi:hypothetical protein